MQLDKWQVELDPMGSNILVKFDSSPSVNLQVYHPFSFHPQEDVTKAHQRFLMPFLANILEPGGQDFSFEIL